MGWYLLHVDMREIHTGLADGNKGGGGKGDKIEGDIVSPTTGTQLFS